MLGLVLCVGCLFRDNPPVSYPQEGTFDENKLVLGPGDKIELVIYFGTREAKAQYVLDDRGDIAVQHIGTVSAGGKSPTEVKDEIRKRLADGYFNEPIVSLSVTEINSRRVSVLGQVIRSGPIKFTPGMRITEAIAQSGGFAPMARKNMVKVTRQINGKSEIYKIPVEMIAEGSRPNFSMMPGDEIFVPERPW